MAAPTKRGTERRWNPLKKEHGPEEPFTRAGGQKHDEGRVDFLVRLHKVEDGQRAFEIVGGRFNKGAQIPNTLFKNPNMARIMKAINMINSTAPKEE